METYVSRYMLEQNGQQYILTIGRIGDNIRLTCQNKLNPNSKFTRDYTIEDLKQIDKIFDSISETMQGLDYINTLIRNQKVRISEDNEQIKLSFYLEVRENKHKVDFPLNEQTTTTTTTITNNEYTTSNYETVQNYDINAFQNVEGEYTTGIDTTTDITTANTYENVENISSGNYLENYDTTNTVVDNGFDYNNLTTTETQEITTTQYQDNSNINNEFQSSVPIVTTPIENYQTYESTQNYEQYTTNIQQTSTEESLPYITPVEEDNSYQNLQTTTTTTVTNTNYSDERINKLLGDTANLKNEQQQIHSQLNTISGQLNNYQNLIEIRKSNNEIQSLRSENQSIKQQLQGLNMLRSQAAEANYLRSKLNELNPLRQKAAQVDALKAQLAEKNSLRQKVVQLNQVKEELAKIDHLKNELDEINALQKQIEELNEIRKSQIENNEIKNRIEELENIRASYEKEISDIKESQARALMELKQKRSLESRQIVLEDKPTQFVVKGDILHGPKELELLTRRIFKSNNKITLNLIYKATADSDKAEAFHKKCDRASSTLVLIETDKGKRFGGFTKCSWAGECIEKKDENAFVFSLDKMETYDIIPNEEAIGCYPKFGPIFLGCQIRIYDNAFTQGGTTFEKGMNYNTQEDFELNGGEREFIVKEIEVYEVIIR